MSHLKHILVFSKLEFFRIFRDSDLRSMVLIAPLVYAFLLSFVYYQGRVTEVPVGVVMKNYSQKGQELVKRINKSQQVKIVQQYNSHQEATNAILSGEINAWIEVPSDFSKEESRGKGGIAWLAANSSNFMLANPVLMTAADAALDMSENKLILRQMSKGQVRSKAEAAAKPIVLDTRLIFNPSLNYSNFFVPGFLFAILQQIIIVGFCLSILTQVEQSSQPLQRSFTWLVGSTIPYWFFNTGFAFLFILTIYPALGMNVQWSQWPLALILTSLFTIASSMIGSLFSFIFKDKATALIALMFYSMPAFLLSGYSWPQFALPLYLKILSWLVPITHFGQSLRIVMLDSQVSFRHIQSSILALISFIVITGAINYYLGKKNCS